MDTQMKKVHTTPRLKSRRMALTMKHPRLRARGQALPIVAISLLVLFAIVGLAVDGGSLYSERRRAQNASDSASIAGTRTMLGLYQQMIESYPVDVDGSAAGEDAVWNAIRSYALENGVNISGTNALKAYFVNDNKQVVTEALGQGGCGLSDPCQVGSNNSIPWTRGAKGIVVTTHTETDTFFMGVLGWNKIGATAAATAYMGISSETTEGIGLLPIGFFTDTERLDNLQVGQVYSIINGSDSRGSGNWGFINFNGEGGPAPVVNAWIECGFNPAMTTNSQWMQWCAGGYYQNETRAKGPVEYWTGANEPLTGPFTGTRVDYAAGWWIAGSSGTTNSTCQYFEDIQDELRGRDYLIPVFDRSNGRGGSNTKFHLIALLWFRITDTDIECRPRAGEEAHWSIQGEYMQRYNAGGTGRHGDVRRTSNPVVFLEP